MEFPNLHNYNFDEKKKEELIHVISVKFFEKIFNLIEDNCLKKICQCSFDSIYFDFV